MSNIHSSANQQNVGGQSIDHLTTLNGVTAYDRKFQDEVLSQWEELRRCATRR